MIKTFLFVKLGKGEVCWNVAWKLWVLQEGESRWWKHFLEYRPRKFILPNSANTTVCISASMHLMVQIYFWGEEERQWQIKNFERRGRMVEVWS